MPGYNYTERQVAPYVVEYAVRTNQGHRVVRVSLDGPSPRITAFNDINCTRSPATMYWWEIESLIERAKSLCNVS